MIYVLFMQRLGENPPKPLILVRQLLSLGDGSAGTRCKRLLARRGRLFRTDDWDDGSGG